MQDNGCGDEWNETAHPMAASLWRKEREARLKKKRRAPEEAEEAEFEQTEARPKKKLKRVCGVETDKAAKETGKKAGKKVSKKVNKKVGKKDARKDGKKARDAPKKVGKKARKAAEIRKRAGILWAPTQKGRKLLRHMGRSICPGSVTDRYARGLGMTCIRVKLTAEEWRLLRTGAISWQWLRDEWYPATVPGGNVPKEDVPAHADALRWASLGLSAQHAGRLDSLDEALQSDALWPPCAERVKLAERLRGKGGLRRRWERHFDEVLAPLLGVPSRAERLGGTSRGLSSTFDSDSESSPGVPGLPGDGPSGDGGSMVTPLMALVRQLCARGAAHWRRDGARPEELDADALKLAWKEMLQRALAMTAEGEWAAKGGGQNTTARWLCALRYAVLARLCPWANEEAQHKFLQRVAVAAAPEASGTEQGRNGDGEVVVLPLGVFTCWQVLLVVGLARWLGVEATVVRRTALGAPSVFFRSSEAELPRT